MESSKDQSNGKIPSLETLKSKNLKYISLLFTDLTGALRCLEEPVEKLKKLCEKGVGVDGSSVPGYANIERSDVRLVPDEATCGIFQFVNPKELFRVICSIKTPENEAHLCDPRNILQKVVDKAKNMGYDSLMMAELEFYLFNSDGTPNDRGGYLCMPPDDAALPFRHELAGLMEAAGMRVKRIHHECAPGQNEVELDFTPALKNADDTMMGIWLTRVLAQKYGWVADFTPKKGEDVAGNGLHQHMQLIDMKNGDNVFAGQEEGWLSKTALQFIAGIMKYADEIIAIQSREQGSFDRMQPGHEAPAMVAWDFMNRSAMIRIPMGDARVEYRAGDASGSPHVLQAAILFAGLKGIEENLDPVPKISKNLDHLSEEEIKTLGVHRLPNTKEECIKILKNSKFVEELLTKKAVEFLVNTW